MEDKASIRKQDGVNLACMTEGSGVSRCWFGVVGGATAGRSYVRLGRSLLTKLLLL